MIVNWVGLPGDVDAVAAIDAHKETMGETGGANHSAQEV